MNNSEAADQIVNMSLKGIEVIARLSGAGAKNLATYLYAVLKDQKKTKGKSRLQGLLRSGKELKVFAVRNEDLKRFTQEAKRYGVLYCALRDKKSLDGMCDIMVRVEDASKINRIVERFKLATVDTASIKSDIQKSRAAKQEGKASVQKATPAEKSADDFIDDLMSKPARQKGEENDNSNPTMAKTEKSRPSEPISMRNGKPEEGTKTERRSVRQELSEIREQRTVSGKAKEQTVSRQSPKIPNTKSNSNKTKAR